MKETDSSGLPEEQELLRNKHEKTWRMCKQNCKLSCHIRKLLTFFRKLLFHPDKLLPNPPSLCNLPRVQGYADQESSSHPPRALPSCSSSRHWEIGSSAGPGNPPSSHTPCHGRWTLCSAGNEELLPGQVVLKQRLQFHGDGHKGTAVPRFGNGCFRFLSINQL